MGWRQPSASSCDFVNIVFVGLAGRSGMVGRRASQASSCEAVNMSFRGYDFPAGEENGAA
jgi:hypothetical protein